MLSSRVSVRQPMIRTELALVKSMTPNPVNQTATAIAYRAEKITVYMYAMYCLVSSEWLGDQWVEASHQRYLWVAGSCLVVMLVATPRRHRQHRRARPWSCAFNLARIWTQSKNESIYQESCHIHRRLTEELAVGLVGLIGLSKTACHRTKCAHRLSDIRRRMGWSRAR